MALETRFDRFPRPEFATAYQAPQLQDPLPRPDWWLYGDVLVLCLALALSILAVFRFRRRARSIQLANAAGCLLYFGFFRKGCICPVGSIQNTVGALADPAFVLPLLAVAFFILPLGAALFRGRVFCGSVCPFGTIQELVNIRPVRVPALVDRLLGLVPPLFLAATVLAVVSGLGFLICRIDPFVGIFRWSAPLATALFAFALLGLGVFVNRPYCRWLCPYGWLLGAAAACASRPVAVAGPGCSSCARCLRACRVGAIRRSEAPAAGPIGRAAGPRWRTALAAVLFLAGGLGAGLAAGPFLASLHPGPALLLAVSREDAGQLPAGSSPETRAFRASGQDRQALETQAAAARRTIRLAALPGGLACSLILFLSWQAARRPRRHPDWSIDPRRCVACGRCMAVCPRGES